MYDFSSRGGTSGNWNPLPVGDDVRGVVPALDDDLAADVSFVPNESVVPYTYGVRRARPREDEVRVPGAVVNNVYGVCGGLSKRCSLPMPCVCLC